MRKLAALLLLVFAATFAASTLAVPAHSAPSRFVHADGKFLVDPAGHKLIRCGTYRGNCFC